MADTEVCCAEVLEQQSAEGLKLQQGWQKLKEEGQKLKAQIIAHHQPTPSRNACIVCFKIADWAIYPCGHTSYCQTHGAIAKAQGDLCPVGRGDITDGMKVFLSGM